MERNNYRLTIMRGSSQYVSPDSYNVQEIGLGKALGRLGWNVSIYSTGPAAYSKQVTERLVWHELPRIGGSNVGWGKDGYRQLAGSDADIIQCQDLSNLGVVPAYRASRSKRIPLVLSLGEYGSARFLKTAVININASLIRSQVKGVLCKTKSAMQFAESLNLASAHYAPVGIDPEVYDRQTSPEVDRIVELMQDCRSEGYTVLTHIGRLDKEDNTQFLMDMISRMNAKVKLVLVGEPKSHVENLPLYQTLRDRVILTGRIANAQIGHLLRASDAYIACSSYEIFGMASAESIYHGCPVIGYSTGGIAEMVDHCNNGYLFQGRNVSEWAGQLDHFISSGKLMEWATGCMAIGQQLSWDARACRYHEVYERLLNSNRKLGER